MICSRIVSVSVLISLAFLVKDATGQNSTVVDPYARYTPGECAWIVKRMERRFWRNRSHDTLYTGQFGEPPQQASVNETRKCVSRFDIGNVREHELLGLGHAYLNALEDNKANDTFQRLVALKGRKTVSERAWAVAQIIDIYLTVQPARVSSAKSYMVLLDSMGRGAAVERLMSHLVLYNAARRADSVSLIFSEANAAIKAGNEIGVDSVRRQRVHSLSGARRALAYSYMRRNDASSAMSALDKALKELVPIRAAVRGDLVAMVRQYELLGKSASAIRAKQWINDKNGGTYPKPDVPTVLTFVSHSCGDECFPGYSILKRLSSKNSGNGINVLFVNRTEGYYRNNLVQPDQELSFIRKFFADDLRLPVTVGTWQADYGRKADGRLDVLSNPNESSYRPAFKPPMQTYVIDKAGRIRFITNMLRDYEAGLSNVMAEVSRE